MIDLHKAQEAINALLTSTGIKAVYYVDDKFEEDKKINERVEEFQNAVRKHHQEGKIDGFPERVCFSDDANLDAEILRWWSEMPSTEVKQQMIEKYVERGVENTRPATLIREIFGEKCECCSPTQWNDKYKQMAVDKIGQKEITLLLFDHDLSNGHTGFQYATETLAVPEAATCAYCGIISQQFTPNEEFNKRIEYKAQQPEHYVYPLSKHRLQEENHEPFIDGIKNILWVKHIELLNKQVAYILNNAFEKTTEKYFAIQPPAYKKIIIESSQKEGAREIDTILRLMQIILDKEIKEAISEEDLSMINNEINKISKIHDSKITLQYPEINQQARKFINDEQFLDGKIINRLYTPLQNGDIFKINRTLYILLCQPCNISVRSEGNRGNNYDTGFLVRLQLTKDIGIRNTSFSAIWDDIERLFSEEEKQANSQKLNGHKKNIQKLLALESPLNVPLDFEIGGNDKYYTVKLNNFKTISLSLLDNVVFNENGDATVDFNLRTVPKGLHKSMVDRRKNIKKQFRNWSKIKHGIDDLCYDCQWLIDAREIFSNFSQELKIEDIKILSDKIKLPIQRIGHYRRPYSDDLLTQFSHYISRAGFPNSFV